MSIKPIRTKKEQADPDSHRNRFQKRALLALLSSTLTICLLTLGLIQTQQISQSLLQVVLIGIIALVLLISCLTLKIIEGKRCLIQDLINARLSNETAKDAQSEYLAAVSHEIRTPLHAILGMSELLAETTLDQEQRKYINIFRDAGNMLSNLINDFLDSEKIRIGKLDFHIGPFDLKASVRSIVDLHTFRAQEKGLTLELEFDSNLPKTVSGDKERLRQILSNLINNAIKYTLEGKIQVHCRWAGGVNGDSILFSVADTGIGIPPEKANQVFSKYVRISENSRVAPGTGLGLFICQTLVTSLGGEIWLESTEKKGTTFYFTLSLPKVEEVKTPPLPSTQVERKPLKILLVEDDPDSRLLIASYLRPYPYEIVLAKDGKEAIELFKTLRFNLVLMDMHMPIIDGLEATKVIRLWEKQENKSETPIVALTANAFDADIKKSLEAGCNGHLTKPIERATLLRTIQGQA